MKQTAIFFSLALLMFSCKKQTEGTDSPKAYTNYSALKVGNYWVYTFNSYDESGKLVNSIPGFDSACISGDTMVNGNRYFKKLKFENKNLIGISYLRDSLHYTVNLDGEIVFSSEDFGRIFRTDYLVFGKDTFCKREFSMQNKNAMTQVPAGKFTTHSFQSRNYMYPNYSVKNPVRDVENKYAAGIGLVYYNGFSTGSTYSYEDYQLLRYKVE